MSLVRIAFLTQFQRDIQALRDSLIGLTQSQLIDPSFHTEGTLAERIALVAAHYFREGEILAYQLGQQYDTPIEEDEVWQLEAIRTRFGWTLNELQSDLEDSWTFYDEMLHEVTDSQYNVYVIAHRGVLPRPAYELSREIGAWRMRR